MAPSKSSAALLAEVRKFKAKSKKQTAKQKWVEIHFALVNEERNLSNSLRTSLCWGMIMEGVGDQAEADNSLDELIRSRTHGS